MIILHTADLHLGKRVNEYSMLEDQRYILARLLELVDRHRPDAVVLAGDIYDKAQPSNEAVELFDWFLTQLAQRRSRVFVLSGNHDSPERVACMGGIVDASGVHLSPVYAGKVTPVTLSDGHGEVDFYMLPFVKPVHVRRWFPEEGIESYTDAIRVAVAHMNVDPARRNVLITHQFVTGALRSDSEEVSVGGVDNVDVSVLEDFDYVALGHIHRPQNIGSKRVRYAGAPLKYAISEWEHQKSVTLAELGAKGELTVTELPLIPQHDVVELRGSFAQLTDPAYYQGKPFTEDYVHIILTDEEEVPDAKRKLERIYHRIMKVDYDNTRTRQAAQMEELEAVERIDPLEIFQQFYAAQNGRTMSGDQRELVEGLIGALWGGGEP